VKRCTYFQAGCLIASLLFFLLIQPFIAVADQPLNNVERLYGNTRFQTMLQIALTFPDVVDNVVLATGNAFPDALAGVPLAHQKEGPLLLVNQTPEQSQEAMDYIKDHLNKDGNIYILGGTAAVPDSFITALENLGFKAENIHRLAGSNRYETALAVAKELQQNGSEFYLVQGDNFPDALSASVLAATTGYVSDEKAAYLKSLGQTISPALGGVPLLLLPSEGPIPASIIDYLNSISDANNTLQQTFKVVGGTGAISEASLEQLRSEVKRMAPNGVTRISGVNRYDTMAKLNEQDDSFDASWQDNGKSIPVPHIYLASGENFPDALAGAVLAARDQAPLVLVNNSLPASVVNLLTHYFDRNQKGTDRHTTVTVLGGPGVITDQTVTAISNILDYGQTMSNQPQVETLAGSGSFGYADGQDLEAEFAMPTGIAVGIDGTIYVADTQNQRIRAISGGKVTTVAGVSNGVDEYGMPVGGYLDGPADKAMFNDPKGIAVGKDGTIYVADSGNGAIREIDKSGNVKTLIKGLNSPSDVVIGSDGELYVSDTLNQRILQVTKEGNWTVFAGGGYQKKGQWVIGGYADGQGEHSQFNEPSGLALGPDGSLYVADTGNQRIRVISPQGVVTTLAGSGTNIIAGTNYIQGGFQDGTGVSAKFNFPGGLAVAPDGTVYVADTYNQCLREISKSGGVKTLAGTGVFGKQDGFVEQAQFDNPAAVAFDNEGNLLIVDQLNNTIRRLTWPTTKKK
jgi:putative cell wall-binding protein/sugar lactone lactonase YvrE